MFYLFDGTVKPAGTECLSAGKPVMGFVNGEELKELSGELGLVPQNVISCSYASRNFRSGVEIFKDYIFSKVRTVDPSGTYAADDCIALIIKKNLLLVVSVMDSDDSIHRRFMNAVEKGVTPGLDLERLVYRFLDELLSGTEEQLENVGGIISGMEDAMIDGKVPKDLLNELIRLKRKVQNVHSFAGHLLYIIETCMNDERGIFGDSRMMYLSNMQQRLLHIREDASSLSGEITHLEDAYAGYVDMKMNHTMNYLTALTTIFFPLTIIVGWYGMNFVSIPEFGWKYGYVYVITLSFAVVCLFTYLAKKHKWF